MSFRDEYSGRNRASVGDDGRSRFAHTGGLPAPWPYGFGSPGIMGLPGALPYGVHPYVGMYGDVAGAYGPDAYGRAQRRPDFSGRGPKNYRRPDARIHDDINERLTRHPDIDPSDVEVDVEHGIVTLRGVVEDRSEKRLVEYVTEDVFGVVDIDNGLKVRHGIIAALTGEKANDGETAAAPPDRARSGDERSPRGRTSVKATVR